MIYSLFLLLLLIDIWVNIYQFICFPVYKIGKVSRRGYINFDRGHLPYLTCFEKMNCNYCSYANGLIAYVREIASRTEQYFCPIKHLQKNIDHHNHYKNFFEYGDEKNFRVHSQDLRDDLKDKK